MTIPWRGLKSTIDEIRDFPYLHKVYGSSMRVHGNGFIQIDITPKLRLHIWDESIPRQAIATPIHDHHFSFKSHILLGNLIDVAYLPLFLEEAEPGSLTRLIAEPVYRLYTTERGPTEDTKLVDAGFSLCTMSEVHTNGFEKWESYSMRAFDFHETRHKGLTVTLMEKTAEYPDHRVRVACPVDLEPDNVFNRYEVDQDAMWKLIECASGMVTAGG